MSLLLVRAEVLYVATGSNFYNGEFYTVNPATGASTWVGSLVISGAVNPSNNGPIGITGLAVRPSTGVLYGVTGGSSPTAPRSLVTINPSTAQATYIGSVGSSVVTDIAFNSAGVLYGWQGGNVNRLVTVNIATGAVTAVGSAGSAGSSAGNGLAISSSGTIYVARLLQDNADDTQFFTINPANGKLTAGALLTGTALSARIPGMGYNASGTLYAVTTDGQGPLETATLVTVNPATGAATTIGSLPDNSDALAFGPNIPSQVLGRYVFYNNSAWDGNNAAANTSDDLAIAPNKSALLPGQTATFTNYTSYSKGLNGIMIDISNLPGTVTTSDFVFKVGNNSSPAGWSDAPSLPVITVRANVGVSSSDRITLTWADNAIQKRWLQVTVLATANTGLPVNDVFYFGNAVGESGNSAANAQVTSVDQLAPIQNTTAVASILNPYDYNRDKKVASLDALIAQANVAVATALQLITVP